MASKRALRGKIAARQVEDVEPEFDQTEVMRAIFQIGERKIGEMEDSIQQNLYEDRRAISIMAAILLLDRDKGACRTVDQAANAAIKLFDTVNTAMKNFKFPV